MPYLHSTPRPDTADWNTREWWDLVKQHKFTVQRCAACGTFRHPPNPVCYKCRSFEYEWAPVSGAGKVFTYTIVTHPTNPLYKDQVPYNVAVIELPDAGGVRMMGNILECSNDGIRVGMPVQVLFEDHPDGLTLPQWRPMPG